MKKILLIEDNDAIIKGLVYSLEQENYLVGVCKNKNDLYSSNISEYDLIVLDITLPDLNGFDICKEIKKNYNVPIIFLTAKDEEDDIVLGFDLGCDDYVTKPFKTRELISRIKRIIDNHKYIILDEIKIDLNGNKVYIDDKEILFTALEYKILLLLFSNLDKIITREYILNNAWDYDDKIINDNTLTVYVKRIRKKLGTDMIKTIKGIGYRVDSK